MKRKNRERVERAIGIIEGISWVSNDETSNALTTVCEILDAVLLDEEREYKVQAKRKDTDEQWTEWSIVDDYDEAVKHAKRAEELGYCSRIVERGANNE